jgi:Xaa-Pro aminopeptidase
VTRGHEDHHGNRRQALISLLTEKAFIAINYEHSDRATLRYLTGFTGEGTLIVTEDLAVLLTDSRYTEQAKRETTGVRIQEGRDWFSKSAGEALRDLSLDRVAFSTRRSTVHWYELLKKEGDYALVGSPDPVNELRAVKTESECESLAKAAAIADEAFTQLVGEIRVGMDEAQLALRLEWLIREADSEGVAFEMNVSAGENSALNHYNPFLDRRKLRSGDLLLFDFGACVDGYRSDITRTLSVGPASGRAQEIYDIVLEANAAAIAEVRAGITGAEIDAVARDVITDAGYGKYFGHGLGHGIGLEVHERPALSSQNKDPLVSGMVATIEPGI